MAYGGITLDKLINCIAFEFSDLSIDMKTVITEKVLSNGIVKDESRNRVR